jgi:hypothetical protein
MSATFLHPSIDGQAQPGTSLIDLSEARRAERACCCPAKPRVVAIMPPASGRPHQTDLLLCGHHYRASRQALAAAGAVVAETGESWPADQAPRWARGGR